MKRIAEFMLEAFFLKQVPRSGYQYLGVGRESVAEHVYCATMIAFVLAQIEPGVNAQRLVGMCLVHDLPEARIGDLNYVQKFYVQPDEAKATDDAVEGLPFGDKIRALIDEFRADQTLEAHLAHDADQLALIVMLKSLHDKGFNTPQTWLPHVQGRLKTAVAKQLAEAVLSIHSDDWWHKLFY